MIIKRGDTVSLKYKTRYGNQEIYTYTVVEKVIRETESAFVKVWNGKVLCLIKEQYDLIEVPLNNLNLIKRKKKINA